MTRRILALTALSWALCALLYVAQPAHADSGALVAAIGTSPRLATASATGLGDCGEADKRDSTGIVRAGDAATITFTLTADCTVSLWSYAQPGPRGALVDSAVASGIGTHTLAVRACAQVDFVPGPTHERGSGEAFTFETYEKKVSECESTPVPSTSPTTAVPATTVPSPSVTAPTTSVVPSVPPASESCVPQCENPDAPESPALAYGGPDPVTAGVLTWAMVLACVGGAVALVAKGER